ncbi:DUF3667 domain-containing protein [Ekhidna sp. MALMAid0563]|uniref:DUF3667 domain-containing protein n=1 Tax=Ekhidna sp. MALMAid0563 TaxID=3143937 RepID=UPI0032DECA2D
MADKSCINCSSLVTGNYCSNCGQKTEVLPITWKGLITELSSRWLGADNRIIRTFIGLWHNPKKVITDYLEGNRVKYIGPLSYLVVMSFLYVLSFEVFGFNPTEMMDEASRVFQDPDQELSEKQRQFLNDYTQMFSKNMRLLVGAIIPFTALSMSIFYRRRNYLQNFLIVSYALSQLLWISIITVALAATTGYLFFVEGLVINMIYNVIVVGLMNPQKSLAWTYTKALIVWCVGYAFFTITISLSTFIYMFVSFSK